MEKIKLYIYICSLITCFYHYCRRIFYCRQSAVFEILYPAFNFGLPFLLFQERPLSCNLNNAEVKGKEIEIKGTGSHNT